MPKSVLKNTYFSSINIYFEYLLGLIISILIARSLGPEQFGVYSYLVKVAGISIILTNAGISTGAIKFIAEARAQGREEKIPAIFKYFHKIQMLKTALVTGGLTVLVLLVPNLLIEEQYRHLLFFLILAIIFKSAHMYRVGVFKGFERFDFLAYTVLLVAPINLLLVCVVKYLMPELANFYMLFSGVAVCYWFISGFYLKRLSLKRGGESAITLDTALRRRISHHLKIVSINTIIGSLAIGQCEVLLLKYYASNEAVSYFTIALTISGAALLLVPGVYSSVLLPVIARSVADVNQDPAVRIKESSRYLFTLGVMVAAPTLYFGEHVVALLYGDAFSQAGIILGFFIVVGTLNAFKEPVNAYLLSVDKQSLMLKLSIFALILSLSVNLTLISQWGLQGAITAYIIVAIVLVVVLLGIAYRFLGIVPDIRKLLWVLVSAFVSLQFSIYVSGFFEGVVEIIVGYICFGLVYLLLLIVLNALSASDYQMLKTMSERLGPKVSAIICLLVNVRLKI